MHLSRLTKLLVPERTFAHCLFRAHQIFIGLGINLEKYNWIFLLQNKISLESNIYCLCLHMLLKVGRSFLYFTSSSVNLSLYECCYEPALMWGVIMGKSPTAQRDVI